LLEHIAQRDKQTPGLVKSAYGLENSWVFYQDACYQMSELRSVMAPHPSVVIFSL